MYFTVFLKKDDDDDDSTTCQGRIQVQIFQGGGGGWYLGAAESILHVPEMLKTVSLEILSMLQIKN